MTATHSSDENDARAELSRSRELARSVRRAQRATWFPLLVFAVVTFAAVPVARAGHPAGLVCRSVPQAGLAGRVCVAHNSATFVYWPLALVLGYALIAAFYVRQSRERGVGSRIAPYVWAGIAIAVVVTVASVWASRKPLVGEYDFLGWHVAGQDVYRVVAPACAIGLGLLVLAAVERNLVLLAVTIGYLIIAVGGIDFGWTIATPLKWGFLPHLVIQGSLLLVASIGFAAAEHPARRVHA